MVYDIEGNKVVSDSQDVQTKGHVLVAVVLGAGSAANRFTAMKELLDIGKKKIADPDATISASEYSHASHGAICELPVGNPAMYEKYSFDYLYTKAETTQAVPASTTKVMSLITGLDYVDNVKEVITISSNDVQGGSGNYFSAGDTMTIEELMLAMMLPSSNTAATAFGRVCGKKMLLSKGTTSPTDAECLTEFLSAMAKKASYIGMTNSVFTSASGLANGSQVTAKDMLQMMIEACSYPQILKVWNKKSYTIAVGGTNPRNVNLTTTVTDQTIEASYAILGGKTGILGDGSSAAALVMVAGIK